MAQSTSPEDDQDETVAPTKDELYERATALAIKGRRKMNRDDLEAAVLAAEKELAQQEAVTAQPEAPPDLAAATGAAAESERDQAPQEATQAQAQKIFAATTEQLEGIVVDPALAPHLKHLVVQELGRRTAKAKADVLHQQAVGAMERFKVTRGGRYITRDGFPTELATGSVITPLTHDLGHVRGQGIVLEPAKSVTVGYDQLGNLRSEVS